MGWRDLYEDFDELSQAEKLALYEAIKNTLFPEPRLKLDKVAEKSETVDSVQAEMILRYNIFEPSKRIAIPITFPRG